MMKKQMMVGLTVVMAALGLRAAGDEAKYVFFFLGDGMAGAQVQAAWAYKIVRDGGNASKLADLRDPKYRLNMYKMPVQGMQTTFNDGSLITDSASAGTAFACGVKTKSGYLGVDSAKVGWKSVAEVAHGQGRSVGILTSVSLDHATPAAYYSHVDNRGHMNKICMQLAESGFTFFGGGGMHKAKGDDGDAMKRLEENGYQVIRDREEMLALKAAPRDKVVCINPWLQDSSAMPYDVDRRNDPRGAGNLSLKEMTEVALGCLEKNPKGFFMMVEGGKVDWACHANDAAAALGDVLDFDDAVGVALAFYERHPEETLIVVTGDHETGGMTIGHSQTGYSERYEKLMPQTCSAVQFNKEIWKKHRDTYKAGYDRKKKNLESEDADAVAFKKILLECFGLAFEKLNSYQRNRLEAAYDKSMSGENSNTGSENRYLYGGYEAITVTLTHVVNEEASVGWTTYSHTGIPVPVYSKGAGSQRLGGFFDNTDTAKAVARALGVKDFPVRK